MSSMYFIVRVPVSWPTIAAGQPLRRQLAVLKWVQRPVSARPRRRSRDPAGGHCREDLGWDATLVNQSSTDSDGRPVGGFSIYFTPGFEEPRSGDAPWSRWALQRGAPPVRFRGLGRPAQPPAQVGPRGVRQVVVGQ